MGQWGKTFDGATTEGERFAGIKFVMHVDTEAFGNITDKSKIDKVILVECPKGRREGEDLVSLEEELNKKYVGKVYFEILYSMRSIDESMVNKELLLWDTGES